MKREQFTFYRSYYEAIKSLPAKELKSVLLAVCAYALDEEIPSLSGTANSVFVLIRPTLDSGRKKAANRANKRASNAEQIETNAKQTQNKTEQTRNESEVEREVEREDDMSISRYNNPIPDIPDARASVSPQAERKESPSVGYFLRKINSNASGECLRELLDFERAIGSEACLYALRYAVDEQKTAWSYIRAILAAYVRDGVKSADDAKRRDQQRGNRPQPNAKNAGRNAQFATHGAALTEAERKAIAAALEDGA